MSSLSFAMVSTIRSTTAGCALIEGGDSSGITPANPEREVGVLTQGYPPAPSMKAILTAVAITTSAAALLSGGTPASAQSYFTQYNSRPSSSFTGYSGTRYNIYAPKNSSNGYSFGSSFDQPSRSNRG